MTVFLVRGGVRGAGHGMAGAGDVLPGARSGVAGRKQGGGGQKNNQRENGGDARHGEISGNSGPNARLDSDNVTAGV